MKSCSHPGRWTLTALAAGLPLLVGGTAHGASPASSSLASAGYSIQPIVKLGDAVADVNIRSDKKNGYLYMGTLNDDGQIAFVAANGDIANSDMLLQYAGGQFIPIVVGGRNAPGGTWTRQEAFNNPVSMNQQGNIAFATIETIGGKTVVGTYRWDLDSRQITTIAVNGMPAVNNLAFVEGTNGVPIINNNDEIAFPATVRNTTKAEHGGIFFVGRDGQLQAVALPDQVMPSGEKVVDAVAPDLNDVGAVAFCTARSNQNPDGAYVWENGTITTVAVAKQVIPGVGTVAAIGGAWVNNQSPDVMVDLSLQGNSNNGGFYRFSQSSLTPLVAPGQAMPGGGTLLHVGAVSGANNAGQRAFIGFLKDGTRSAYLLNADGTATLLLQTGAVTPLGKITNIGQPSGYIGLNNKGQVAVNVAFAGVTTMVLLTPAVR